MDSDEAKKRRKSSSSLEKVIFYVDELSTACRDSSPELRDINRQRTTNGDFYRDRLDEESSIYYYPPNRDSIGLRLDDRSALYPTHFNERHERSSSVCSQSGITKRSRTSLDANQRRYSRRLSTNCNRSKSNGYGQKSTPLGKA